jgi:hypothetical protein
LFPKVWPPIFASLTPGGNPPVKQKKKLRKGIMIWTGNPLVKKIY